MEHETPEDIKRETCVKCKGWVGTYMRFCMACGTKNLNFSEVDYLIESDGETPEDFMARECDKGHPETLADTKGDPTLFVDTPFCSVCGKRIDFRHN